jgi:hypothetical protein
VSRNLGAELAKAELPYVTERRRSAAAAGCVPTMFRLLPPLSCDRQPDGERERERERESKQSVRRRPVAKFGLLLLYTH